MISKWLPNKRTFSALTIPNYRRFIFGQTISLIGTSMQQAAMSWLVFVTTHSPTDIGIVVAFQTLPLMLLGPYGGVVADRVDKRKMTIFLQAMMGLQALALGISTLAHVIPFAEICVLAAVLGVNNAFETPCRQAFVFEMVGTKELRNAVSLNSTLQNVGRAVGPAIAGLLIAAIGDGWCFIGNALSFIPVVGSLIVMDKSALQPSQAVARQPGQMREGLRYVIRAPQFGIPILMMALVGMLAYEWQVTLTVAAKNVFHGNAETYGLMIGAMGVGSVLGGLVSATRGKTGMRNLIGSVSGFGVSILFAALAPNRTIEFIALVLVGIGGVSLLSSMNSTLQLGVDSAMRGRVMALWAVAAWGTTPIGGPIVGWITGTFGARVGLGTGAAACFVSAAIGIVALRHIKKHSDTATNEVMLAGETAPRYEHRPA